MIEVENLSLEGIKLIKTKKFYDDRGSFQQNYHRDDYKKVGILNNFIQDNWSTSEKGVLRGLHYQLNFPQAKLVQVLKGEVYDVAVDLRINSPTFKKWIGVILNPENGYQLYIPRGFAHGFLTLKSDTEFIYKCDNFYVSNDEYGIRWDDENLKIDWPKLDSITVSPKDQLLSKLSDAKYFSSSVERRCNIPGSGDELRNNAAPFMCL